MAYSLGGLKDFPRNFTSLFNEPITPNVQWRIKVDSIWKNQW